jgi:hypothetical protein
MTRLTRSWLLALALAASASACSLISGWADLQNGSKTVAADAGKDVELGTTRDDGGGPLEERSDAATDGGGDASPPPPALRVSCGLTTCSGTDGCCDPDPGFLQCMTRTRCLTDLGGVWFTCDRPSACANQPDKKICCYDSATAVATCESACSSATTSPVCDITNDVACSRTRCSNVTANLRACD